MQKKHSSCKHLKFLFVMLSFFGLFSCTMEDNNSVPEFKSVIVDHPVLGELTNNGMHLSCVPLNPVSEGADKSIFFSTKKMTTSANSQLIWFCSQKDITFDIKMGTGSKKDPVVLNNVSNGMITDFILSDQLYISIPTNITETCYVVCSVVEIPNRGLTTSNDNIEVAVANGHQKGQKHRASDNFKLGSYAKYIVSCPNNEHFDLMEDVTGSDKTHYKELTNKDTISCISGDLYIANSSNAMTVTFMPVITSEEWMSKISGDKKLYELSIPGTHDSGTYLSGAGNAKCQNFDAQGQLASGIRFFDVRLDNDLELCHGSVNFNVHFDDMLKDFYAFLKNHPSEVILMCVKDETGDNIVPNKFKNYAESHDLGKYLYTGNQIPSLKDCRGKIVLFRRFALPSNTSSYGIDLYSKFPSNGTEYFTNKEGVKLYIEDHYYKAVEIHDTEEKASDVALAIKDAVSGYFNEYLFIIFNSMAMSAGSVATYTPWHWAWEAKPNLSEELKKTLSIYEGDKARVGIVLMDFYNKHGNDDYCNNVERIVNTNFDDKYLEY